MPDQKSLMKRFYDEVFSAGNVDTVDELATEGLVDHEEGPPGTPSGREGVKAIVTMFREGFPDLKAEVAEQVEEGDLAVTRATFSGTHKGEFMGIPASGKSVSFDTIDIVRFDGDKVVEHWGVTDTMSLMQQIGAIPAE